MLNILIPTILSLLTIFVLLKMLKWTKILMEDLSEEIGTEKAIDGFNFFETHHD